VGYVELHDRIAAERVGVIEIAHELEAVEDLLHQVAIDVLRHVRSFLLLKGDMLVTFCNDHTDTIWL
jgi:hypothetical protein